MAFTDGRISLDNGVHRWSVAAELGIRRLPVKMTYQSPEPAWAWSWWWLRLHDSPADIIDNRPIDSWRIRADRDRALLALSDDGTEAPLPARIFRWPGWPAGQLRLAQIVQLRICEAVLPGTSFSWTGRRGSLAALLGPASPPGAPTGSAACSRSGHDHTTITAAGYAKEAGLRGSLSCLTRMFAAMLAILGLHRGIPELPTCTYHSRRPFRSSLRQAGRYTVASSGT